jgi:hypothetical protein
MNEGTSPPIETRCLVSLRWGSLWVISPGAAILLLGLLWAGQKNPNPEGFSRNPHRDIASCLACHTSGEGGRDTLRFNGDVLQLCQSCHDGRLATQEVHAVNLAPSATMAQRIPADLPLEGGVLTCLTCHDVARTCSGKPPAQPSDPGFLRGAGKSDRLTFCFRCHAPEDYRPFNPHDQLEAGKPKPDVCAWCHVGTPQIDSQPVKPASYGLRAASARLCKNCHAVAETHPVVSHMGALPSTEMKWHMSAREMEPKMRLPLEQLVEYARAAKREPRSIPLEQDGRVTCHSCHNPHEKGLLPEENPRSVGAEPKKAANHRLRVRIGKLCTVCHQK